ncbi:MAG: hypothetical protein ABEJ36_02970 [Candidatus Nanosalina sp.]
MPSPEDAKETFEQSPKFRKDEKDGRYFPYDFRPGGQPTQGVIFQTVDNEYRILYIPHNVDDKIVSKEKENGFIELERLDPESEDFRRDEMFWIHHSDGEDNHMIKVVIEQNSHPDGDGEMLSPHLNWKGENDDPGNEEYIDCEKCREYFEFINHIELEFDITDEVFKRANWEDTLIKFCEEIRDSKFYEENEVKDLVNL